VRVGEEIIETLVIEYAGNELLRVPVHRIDVIERWVSDDEGEPPRVHRIGGRDWSRTKKKTQQAIEAMTAELLELYATREASVGHAFAADTRWQREMESSFLFDDTPDQRQATEDVKRDMESVRPMDRLICGDVGYGKTEIAIRAAFKAVQDGKQVAVLVPTTILAEQHLRSFSERLASFPVRIESLSRFRSAKEQTDALARLEKGDLDIIIGTHRLLSPDVKFKELGLLVVDEEQRFGVKHKERLKQLKQMVDVLTLTATPIPRTLHFSLLGVRDMTLIQTPPRDRQPIITHVLPWSDAVIEDAIRRELDRGGQVFFVHNRVETIATLALRVSKLVPDARIAVAHGQMKEKELDDIMRRFVTGDVNVLVATSIIESGLDVPNANTLIVDRADQFGLAQLYQIRGRVGRSKTRAYAYLTTKPRAKLTATADKRLRVLGSLDSLGAGFTLASQDLDIRGAGNLVGEEQSGHVREVGYELYQSMLEETIAKLKSGQLAGLPDESDPWAPQINLGVPVLIPEEYVPDLDVRLGLYRRLSELDTKVELEGFAAELIDRFGKLPKEVNTLLLIVRIKAECKKAGIAKLDGGPKGATIQFHNDKFASPAGLVEFIREQDGHAKVKDNKIIVRRDWKRDSDKIKGAFAIARDLASKAQPLKEAEVAR
jgi:transcription-repair coupling factor (superfamily II helicase)